MPYKFDRLRMRLRLLGSQDWSTEDKCFIVSTGRTGTKFFAHFLNQFSSTYAVHEPSPALLRLGINYARNKVTKQYATQKIERYRRPMCKQVKRENVDKYIESNNRFFSLLEPLNKVFKQSKIIHIVRDGRDYVRSGMSRNWYTEDDKSHSRLRAIYFPDDPYYDQWDKMSRFEKICWRWQKKDGFILDSITNVSNVITVKFEDIFKDENYSGLYKITDYLKLDRSEVETMVEKMMNKRVNSTKDYEISKWPNWRSERKEKFDEIAGEHMKNYYDYKW